MVNSKIGGCVLAFGFLLCAALMPVGAAELNNAATNSESTGDAVAIAQTDANGGAFDVPVPAGYDNNAVVTPGDAGVTSQYSQVTIPALLPVDAVPSSGDASTSGSTRVREPPARSTWCSGRWPGRHRARPGGRGWCCR